MSNNKALEQEQAFANWLDGKSDDAELNDKLNDEMNKELNADSSWQKRKDTAHFIEHQIAMSSEVDVPTWDRASAFKSDKVPFWQWRGLPAMSMAFSMFAMALVLFKVELIMQDDGILLSFAGSNAQQQDKKIAKLVDEKLQGFAQEQQVVLANYAADIKVQQQDSNLQLASYIIGASRQEREEDISDFIQYINAQRKDDALDQKIKYQQLEQAIKYNKTYQRDNTNSFGLNQDGTKITPVNWTSEE
ncbi:hypothetical protein [Cognaticolwellia mytili]|uniref:hypothetical protein n=1 Tax=Cognaticolwellia mytili TaxID=1888913 RepID=UPI000A176792|nr:hypothetical protein [Cognaticolwellia mytili]